MSDTRNVHRLRGRCRAPLLAVWAGLTWASPSLGQPVRVEHVEVVQVIQDLEGRVPLLEGKPTAVRVFLSSSAARPLRAVLRLRGADGSLVRTYDDALPALPAIGLADLKSLRQRRDASLNFRLPPGDVRFGLATVEVTAILEAGTGVSVPCTNCPRQREIRFREAPVLPLLLVSYRYPSKAGTKLAPRDSDLDAAEAWIRDAYPIRDLRSRRRVVDADPAWGMSCVNANRHVSQIRASDVANGADPRTHYLVVVADQELPTGFAGCADRIPSSADPSAVATLPAGPFRAQYGWDKDGTYADWLAGHELGHTLGRWHPGPCGAGKKHPSYPYKYGKINDHTTDYVGWNVDSATPYGIDNTHDVMSYCPNPWPSAYTYEELYARLRDEWGMPVGLAVGNLAFLTDIAAAVEPPPQDPVATGDTTRWVTVLGVVDLTDRSGEIQAVVDAAPESLRSLDPPESVRLVLRDTAGVELDSFSVHLQDTGYSVEPGRRIGIFQEQILLDTRTAALELVLGNTVLDRVVESGPTPTVEAVRLAPRPHESRMPLVFTWEVEDVERAVGLTYTVLVWFDNEQVPETLAAGLRKPRIEIDDAQRMGRSVTRIEILASDGLRIGRFRSGRLQ